MPNIVKSRPRAFHAQHCLCFYCGLPMWKHGGLDQFVAQYGISIKLAKLLQKTDEHLAALQNGGPNTAENIVAACRFCNHKRHAHRPNAAPDPETYRRRVKARMQAGRWHPANGLLQGVNTLLAAPQ